MRSARQWHRHRYVDGNNLYTQFDIKYADIRQWDTYNLWYRILNYEHCRIIWSFLVRFWHIFMVEICKIGGDWVTLSPLYLSIGNTHTHTHIIISKRHTTTIFMFMTLKFKRNSRATPKYRKGFMFHCQPVNFQQLPFLCR